MSNPNPYQGFSNTDWARAAATTLADHIRTEEQAWMRNFQLGALLEANGRISYNHSGRGFTWPVRFRRHQLEGNTGETPRNFVRRNLWMTAALEYRGYQATDSITLKEQRENRGEPAVIQLMDNFVMRISDSMQQGIATEFYIDGNATGNEQSWHGLESMFGPTTSPQTVTEGTAGAVARSANAADWVLYPNDTYAGISTVLGNYGGDGDPVATWPKGVADPEFDFWSPVVVAGDTSNTSGSTDTWAATGTESMRFMIIHTQRNSMQNGQLTNIMLDRDMYFELLNLIDDKEQIQVNRNGPEGLVALGFRNVINFDGLEVSWETGVPSGVGYGLNYQNIELRCMGSTLFESEGPIYDEHTQRFNAVVFTLSNLKFNSPRNFGKIVKVLTP